ncbi:DUF4926 domain-containing protein [Neobacillus sp. PS3-34]|uniref:DUF4926 domain-containing protein n=1 Tax=Neobacillus sp. PS3-34 TaxID=3070678 RepID=UPI0027E03B84|nr:DUF4926 domain-containing protein [Neobacillus sp. PS3-34]WML46715.1 DUF4926 domain-containing protein [Neobacillus sp. PS3-34]
MKQFDQVRILKDIPDEGISIGQIGYILEVYDDYHFEVEISDCKGQTLFLGSLPAEYLEVV